MYSAKIPASEHLPTSPIVKSSRAFGQMKEALFLSDTNRKVVWVNQAFVRLTGYSLSEVLGRKASSLFDQATSGMAQGVIPLRGVAGPGNAGALVSCLHKSGRAIRSETADWAVCNDAGDVIGYAILIHDMDAKLNLQNVLASLYDISASQTLNSHEKINAILRLGCEYFRLPTARVGAVQNGTYTVMYSLSTINDAAPGTQFDLADLACAETFQADDPVSSARALMQDVTGGDQSYIGMNLMVDGLRMGTLSFFSPLTRRGFSQEEIELIKLLAAWVAQEIHLIKIYEELNHAATTDWLTGASTRRHFHPAIEQAFRDFALCGRVSSVVMLDIDHFKRVNDTYGHAIGDQVLGRVADILRDHVTVGGQFYRIGGEEFALLLRDTTASEVLDAAEEMRRAVDRLSFEHASGAFNISVSLGAATLHEQISDARAWLYHADAALYTSKSRGRNRVSTASVDNVLDFYGTTRSSQSAETVLTAEAGNG
ncbi:MAG: diguanylate cyclase [Roseovarius sp.]